MLNVAALVGVWGSSDYSKTAMEAQVPLNVKKWNEIFHPSALEHIHLEDKLLPNQLLITSPLTVASVGLCLQVSSTV